MVRAFDDTGPVHDLATVADGAGDADDLPIVSHPIMDGCVSPIFTRYYRQYVVRIVSIWITGKKHEKWNSPAPVGRPQH